MEKKIEVVTNFRTVSDWPAWKLGTVSYQCQGCSFATLVADEAWEHAKKWPRHILTETLVESETSVIKRKAQDIMEGVRDAEL